MQAKLIAATIAAVVLTHTPCFAQDKSCKAQNAEITELDAEQDRLKAFAKEVEAKGGQDILGMCKLLTGFQALDKAMAIVFRKCAISDNRPELNDLAIGYEQEAEQVYGRNASAMNCRYITK